jgi:adenosine deaminase
VEDPGLVRRLGEEQVPLTVCPLFNVRLRGFPALEEHPVKRMLREGLCVTVHSDDPAYFGGYVADNYSAMRNCSPKLGEQMTHRSLIWRIRWLHF